MVTASVKFEVGDLIGEVVVQTTAHRVALHDSLDSYVTATCLAMKNTEMCESKKTYEKFTEQMLWWGDTASSYSKI